MKKLAILLTILMTAALCGFVYREAPGDNTLPVRMTVSDGEGTEVSAEDEAAIREIFDLYLALRAEAEPAEASAEPDGAVLTVRFYEAGSADAFGVSAEADGSFRFFGEEEQPSALVYTPPAFGDEDAQVLAESVRARLAAAGTEGLSAFSESGSGAAAIYAPGTEEAAPGEEIFYGDGIGPIPEETAGDTAPALDGDASVEPEEEPSAEPAELPEDITELLGSYSLALGGAHVADRTVRTDPETPPAWAEETEHAGAEVTVYYARSMDQYELRWQRWWTDGTYTESAAAEEFENAREFYRTAMPGFTEGLTAGGWDAFGFDLSGDVTLFWYDEDLDLIFSLTAFQGGVGGSEASLGTLVSLAELVSG